MRLFSPSSPCCSFGFSCAHSSTDHQHHLSMHPSIHPFAATNQFLLRLSHSFQPSEQLLHPLSLSSYALESGAISSTHTLSFLTQPHFGCHKKYPPFLVMASLLLLCFAWVFFFWRRGLNGVRLASFLLPFPPRFVPICAPDGTIGTNCGTNTYVLLHLHLYKGQPEETCH